MGTRRYSTVVSAAVVLLFSLDSFRLLACSCAPPPPPCEAVGQAQLVFLGTVMEVHAESGGLKTARMRIDAAYKGALRDSIELFDNGMCDGPDLQVGRQYLMYTSGLPTEAVPARGCTRSRSVEAAKEDLEFLEQYKKGTPPTQVRGTVRFRPNEPEDSELGEKGRTPLPGVAITLSGDGAEFQTTTKADGSFVFSGLRAGSYEIDAELAGYRLNWSPGTLALQ